MPNENHETYGGNDICTYTDDISGTNEFTNEQIEACVLSAGIALYSNPLKLVVANFTHEQCTGGPNLYSPFYKESNSNILWYDESGLGSLESTNYWWYRHHIYVSKTGNKIATSLKVQNYRNFLEIITHTWADIRGTAHKTYYPRVTTKYGTVGDWHDSVLQPACLIYNTTNGALAKSVEQTEPQSYWYWGGPSNVQNGMGGGNLFTRDLNNGTVTNDSYAVPWEPTGSDPIRIKEGGSDYTFPVAFAGDHITSVFYGGNPLNLHQGFNTPEDAILFCAFLGLKFEYNETVYKPLASGGVVYGYTNDMSERSDWDNWQDIGDHEIPVTPPSPGPPPPGDDDDDTSPINTTGAPYAAGLAHYYAMTAGSVLLEHVASALSTWDIDTSKKDLYRNLISCKLIKPPAPIPVSGSEDFTIYGVVPQYQGAGVKLPVINGNPENTFGPYTISRKFGDFRDYSPYTKAEIYLPYCGWCALPSHVVGRSVRVKYFTDIIAATVKAVVFCGNNIVAEAAGVMGLDIPFAAENVGAKMEAVNAGLLATAAGGVQLASGVGSMVATKSSSGLKGAASGLSQYISGYTQMAMAFNENWTEISGKNGDGCCLSGATNIIIKVTRPKYGAAADPPYVPAGYAHNIGYVSNKSITVNQASGLLICDNADTSGISGATDAERAEIKRILETGIYVNSPPE